MATREDKRLPVEKTTIPDQKPLSVILDEIEERARLASTISYAGNVTNAKSAMDVPALLKALRRANEIISECDPDTVYFWNIEVAAILNQK